MKSSNITQIADWKMEKHVPVIEVPKSIKAGEKFTVQVSVGKKNVHPNTTKHHICWIRLYFKPNAGKFAFDMGLVEFAVNGETDKGHHKGLEDSESSGQIILKLNSSGTLVAMAYCNIHGLWEYAKPIKVEV